MRLPHAASSETYYQRLGLSFGASPRAVRRAYRQLSKRYHPDTSPLPPEVAIQRFHALQEAYTVLSNPKQRALYDSTLWLQHPPAPPPPHRSSLEWEPETRPLSGTEIFTLLLMLGTFVGCLLLVGVIAWLNPERSL
ncbi:MAG: J domain-containing protein [Synechococcaceae cyanobacterium SM2_3_1]|nr:J domain-containing protein [Synechococcaceae cyanobacterium SM2_3_1]